MDLENAIRTEMANMTNEDLIAALQNLKAKRERAIDPEKRKAYYEARKNTPEWKEQRKKAAAKRQAKQKALLALAIERLGADKVAELGFRVS